MAFDTLGRKDLRIDAFPVVPHPQSEFMAVVADLDLDQSGLRVTKSIPQRFRRNLVDLVAKDRCRSRGCPSTATRNAGDWPALASVASPSPKVLIATGRSVPSTADARKPCTASRPSVMAFAACSIAVSSLAFASAGRPGSRYDAVWNRSNRPWKL